MIWWGILIIFFLLVLLGVSCFFLVRFGLIIIRVQDTLEDALDVLDERYTSIDEVIKTPLFYDSPEVRKVLNDIRYSRESILSIARALTSLDELPIEELDEKRVDGV